MPQLVIPKTYAANNPPRSKDLDNIRLTVESFVNSGLLNEDNLQVDALLQALTSTQAIAIVAASRAGEQTSAITVPRSGVYLVSFVDSLQTDLSNGSFTSSLSQTVTRTVSLNFAVIKTWSGTASLNTSGSNLRAFRVGGNTYPSFVQSLTAGDVISLTSQSSEITPTLTLLIAT